MTTIIVRPEEAYREAYEGIDVHIGSRTRQLPVFLIYGDGIQTPLDRLLCTDLARESRTRQHRFFDLILTWFVHTSRPEHSVSRSNGEDGLPIRLSSKVHLEAPIKHRMLYSLQNSPASDERDVVYRRRSPDGANVVEANCYYRLRLYLVCTLHPVSTITGKLVDDWLSPVLGI